MRHFKVLQIDRTFPFDTTTKTGAPQHADLGVMTIFGGSH
jgi:hypothetical protein